MAFGVILLGIAVLINFMIIRYKFNKGMFFDVAIDIGILILLNLILGISLLGGISATIGSLFISIYLLISPIDTSDISKDMDSVTNAASFTFTEMMINLNKEKEDRKAKDNKDDKNFNKPK